MNGFVVCAPDRIFNGYSTIIFETINEAVIKMNEYKTKSKWPHNVHIRKAFIYNQDGRKVWEPRS